MGLDKIYYTFYRLFGGNEEMEENSFIDKFKYIPAETIFIDGNFVVYQVISKIEKDLNTILKIILAVSHNSDRTKLINNLERILEKSPLRKFKSYFEEIFYLDNLKDMIEKLRNKTINIEDEDNKLKQIISEYYIDYIENNIINLHYDNLIKNIYLIFDGVPCGFKIIEQRRRRFKNFLESNLRKKLLKDKMENFPEDLTLNKIGDDEFIMDYGKFVENIITLPKSFGPSSDIFKIIGSNVKSYLAKKYPKITFWFSGVDENGEADFKILHLCRFCKNNNIVIHCSDFDFIILGSRLQNETDNKIYLIRHFSNNYLTINFTKLNERILNFLSSKYDIYKDIKLIDDFYFTINLFGNDYLPSLQEIKFDSNFLDLIDIIGLNLWKNNKYLLNKTQINFNNFKIILIKLNNKNYKLKNDLKNKYYCNDLLKVLPKDIYSFEYLLENVILPFWLKEILLLESWDDLYQKDMRIDLIQKYIPESRNKLILSDLNEIKKQLKLNINFSDKINSNELNNNLEKNLKNILKPYYIDTYGLKPRNLKYNFQENSYDNLYYYYYLESKKSIMNQFNLLENNNLDFLLNSEEIHTEEDIINKYLLTLDFINYKFYFPMKITNFFYNFYQSPKIEWLINNIEKYHDKPDNYIESENYLDKSLHLIIISPNDKNNYINYQDFFEENKSLIYIDYQNYDIETNLITNKLFNHYKNININKIKKNWENFIFKKKNNLLENKNLSLEEFDTKLFF